MSVFDLPRRTTGLLAAAWSLATNRAPDELPALSRPRLLVGLVGLALAYTRSVSTSRAAATPCPNEQLRAESNVNPATGHPYSSELPDCRAYELLTSELNDNNAVAHPGPGVHALVSGDGGSLLWDDAGTGPYAQPSNGTVDVHRAQRGAGGWSPPRTLAPENVGGGEGFMLAAASGDLSTVLLDGKVLSESHEVGGHTFGGPVSLLESGPGGCCAKIVSRISGAAGAFGARLSADGSHVFFQTQAQLLPEDKHGPINLATGEPLTTQAYEWTRAGGLRLAGVDSEGNATSACGAKLATTEGLSSHDVSADGSRVFFMSPDPQEPVNNPSNECRLGPVVEGKKRYVSDLYVRENGSTTVAISRPPVGVADYGASFVGATSDGSKVFFVSASQLTPDKATSGPDLYEYDVDKGVLRRLSVGPPGYDNADVGSAIASADGSHVYFTALGQLVPGAGVSSEPNLYMYTGGRVSFIATVGNGGNGGTNAYYEPSRVWPTLSSLNAAVTPDGSDLIFNSIVSLTAYNSGGHGELYRYDAASSTLSCVSCSPTGALAEGVIYLHASQPFQNGAEDIGEPAEQVGGLSSDGSTVFFDATGQLLPAAVNTAETERTHKESEEHGGGTEPIGDVYEWHDGVLSLISTGTSGSSDRLIGSSPSGADVFFLSSSQLVGQDGGHAAVIYDARVAGGFAAPAGPPAPCTSNAACRSMLATPPVPVAPASVSVSGAGNLAPVAEAPPATTPTKPKPLTRVQQLSKALKACRKLKGAKRKSCEKQAHHKYGTAAKKKSRKT
jgi:hypothetical protein